MTKKAKKQISYTLPRSVKRLFPEAEFVVDANKPVNVSVNKKDCADAKELDPTNCALAKAAKRELQADGVIIGISSSYIIKGKQAIRFQTPESVRREIVSFDRHHDFAPGDYYLTPKSPSTKLGTSYRRTPHSSGTSKNAKRKIHKGSARVRVLPRGHEGVE